MTNVSDIIIIIFLFVFMISCVIRLNTYNTKEHYCQDMTLPTPYIQHREYNNDIPTIERHFCSNCILGHSTNECIRRRITDKYNLSGIRGGQGMFVNIDEKKLYDMKNLKNKWKKKLTPINKLKHYAKRSKIGCATCQDFAVYNELDCALDKQFRDCTGKVESTNNKKKKE